MLKATSGKRTGAQAGGGGGRQGPGAEMPGEGLILNGPVISSAMLLSFLFEDGSLPSTFASHLLHFHSSIH